MTPLEFFDTVKAEAPDLAADSAKRVGIPYIRFLCNMNVFPNETDYLIYTDGVEFQSFWGDHEPLYNYLRSQPMYDLYML